MTPRLLKKYKEEITPLLVQKLGLKNRLETPRLRKIVINRGVSEGAQDIKVLERACEELALISGQRPIITRAHKAISNFKIRKGSPIGCKVTLRGVRMYEFFDRLISVALPRIKDFRGLRLSSFDQKGNYSFGIDEQTIFPEVDIDKVQKLQGMDITIVTSARRKEHTLQLLEAFGLPFRK